MKERDSRLGRAARRPGGRRGLSGFTILELLIFLAVLSCVAGLAIPAFFERGEVTLENACQLLAKDLRLAQNRAAFLRTPTRIEFRLDGDGYRVVDAEGKELPHPLRGGGLWRRYSRDGVFRGVRVSHVDCGGDAAVDYDSQGFTDGGRVVVQFMDDARILIVHGPRGEVEILGGGKRWSDDDGGPDRRGR